MFTELFEKIRDALSSFAEFVRSNLRIAIIIAAVFLLVILLLFAFAIMSRQSKTEPKQPPVAGQSSGDFFAEDFFLPYEPDFVPGILLEREPRDSWTEEDTRPFWTDPMEGNEEAWRKRIESGVDAILEHIP